MKKPITIVSLFSGCGGMDLGFMGNFDFLGRHYSDTGFKIVWANELSHAACDTYRRNFHHPIVEGDIKDAIDNMPREADVVVGGFPCQDISIIHYISNKSSSRTWLCIISEYLPRATPSVVTIVSQGV